MSVLRLSCCFWLAASVVLGQGNAIRVDVNLIQLDVTVLDKSGGRVPGLGLDDFEVYQDGKRQRLKSATWIQRDSGTQGQISNHIVAVFLDDSHMSFESVSAVRRALLEFKNQHLRHGDSIALFRASEELGTMKAFITNKSELEAAIFDLSFQAWLTVQSGTTISSLQAVDAIVRALGDFPGRKSLIFISDKIEVDDRNRRSADLLNRVTDHATRAGVTIYTIDARGLQYHGLEAREKWNGSIQDLRQMNLNRQGMFLDLRGGMILLAKETGGRFYRDRNDLGQALADATQDQDGYYLLAIQPDEATFKNTRDGPRFHRLDVRPRVKGYAVRHRRGFFGVSREEEEKEGASLVRTLLSPFRAAGISLNMTSSFDGQWKLVFDLSAKQFQFQDQVEDWKEARIDQRIVVFDQSGAKVENLLKHHRIRLRRAGFDKALQDGLRLEVKLKTSKLGTYQVRSAVEDLGNQRRGSVMAYVSIPAK